MQTESEIKETLLAAGCGETEITMILSSIQRNDRKKTEKLITECRKKQLERLADHSDVHVRRL